MDLASGSHLDCSDIVRAAAVIGTTFDLDVLADVVGCPPLECLDALGPAMDAKLLEALGGPERYRFVDTSAHQRVLDQIGASDKVRLHARVAETLGARYGHRLDEHLLELAGHWSAAAVGDYRAPAAGWVGRAAEAASRAGSHAEAARLYRRATVIGVGALPPAELAALRLGLARASYRCGDVTTAITAAREAASAAASAGRADLIAEAALVVEPSVVPGVNEKLRQACATALDALRPGAAREVPGADALEVRVLARLAAVCHYLADDAAADDASRVLDERLAGCEDLAAVATALHAQQLAASGADGVARREQLAAELARIARALDDAVEMTWSHLWRVDIALQRGDLSAAGREITAAMRNAERVEDTPTRWEVLRARAALAQAHARFDDAIAYADSAEKTMTAIGNPLGRFIWLGQRQNICHHTGLTQDVLAALTEAGGAAGPVADAPVIATLGAADVLATLGERKSAAAMYRSLGPAEQWRPALHSDLYTCVLGIKVAVALGAHADVRVLRSRLEQHRGLHIASGAGAVGYFGPVELWLGIAALHLGEHDAAVGELERAAVICGANGAAGFQAESQLQLARALLSRAGPGDALRARQLAEDSAGRADLLGMAPTAAAARDVVGQSLPLRSGELTRREREVAVLVGQGLTNRAIAGRLHLSERTAANHVQHILDKLDLNNRAEIGAWLSSGKPSSD
jgi:DNA-binding CsgD family transcriptional regulator/tetratricopeptide (TPR) repeat protein